MSAIKKLFIGKLKRILAEYEESISLTHSGTIGALREEYLRRLLREVLPYEYEIDSGFIASPDISKLSPQVDILATSKLFDVSFPLNKDVKIHPFEKVVGIFEIKSTLISKDFNQIEELELFSQKVKSNYWLANYIRQDIEKIAMKLREEKLHLKNNEFEKPGIYILTFENKLGDEKILEWYKKLPSFKGIWIVGKEVKLLNRKSNKIETIPDNSTYSGSLIYLQLISMIFI